MTQLRECTVSSLDFSRTTLQPEDAVLLAECIQYNDANSPDALQTVRIRQQFLVGQIRAHALTELDFSAATLSATEIFFMCELLVSSTSITLLDLSGTHTSSKRTIVPTRVTRTLTSSSHKDAVCLTPP